MRGGSKSIPNKNIKKFGGKPLCAWVLDSALKSKEIDQIYVSAYDNAMKDLTNLRKVSNYKIHAAFTIIRALLKHAGMFMVTKMNRGKKDEKYIEPLLEIFPNLYKKKNNRRY